jgi:predicted Zn-dependent protease with MMP-like domain
LEGKLKSNYALHEEHFKDYLAEILKDNLPEDQADSAETLAAECASNDSEAYDKLCEILGSIGLDADTVLGEARADHAKELVQDYVRREPNAVTLVDELLTDAGASMDGLMTDALARELDDIERIDRLTSIAESRRNASLHEIERRRAVLGETLRRSVQEIEDGEFEVIETTPAEGKNVA